MDTTDVLSSYFMTVDMHRFALMYWSTVGTNFSEWVQIFPFRGEPIVGGSKLNVTGS